MSEAAAEYRTEPHPEQFELATDIHQICLLKILETRRLMDHYRAVSAADIDKIITELEQEIIQEVMDWRERTPPWARSIPTIKQMMDMRASKPEPVAEETPKDSPDTEDKDPEELPPPPPPITAPKAPPIRKPDSHKDGGKATKSAAIILRSRIQALLDDGCSIATLAEKAKLSDPTVRNIIGGGTPRAATYDKLAEALDRLGA